MKFLLAIFLISFSFSSSLAQQNRFIGIWEGDLSAGAQKLRLIYTISAASPTRLKATMQSPQQSANAMPVDSIFFTGDSLVIEMKKFGIRFSGVLINDSLLSGQFIQGRPFDLQLKKVVKPSVVSKPKRPQTPVPPFEYKSMDVSFTNNDATLKFAGTLTLPDTSNSKKYPAVILISGSGPQDRDETIFGHKPFAVIADHLTKKGFAVLRVDDRGTGKSTGKHSTATSADFADDAEAALNYLLQNKFIDRNNIGLMGHSEGGQIAPMLAAKRKDVKFIVLLAGPGIAGIDLLTEQNLAIFESNGMKASTAAMYGPLFKKLTTAIVNAKDSGTALSAGLGVVENWQAPDSIKSIFKVKTEAQRATYVRDMVTSLYSPWFRYFLRYDPAPNLKKLTCAVLALNGSKDLQVLPASNLAGIKNALLQSKTTNYEIKEIPQLNHLFQTCKQCNLEEYATLEESFSPVALDLISSWLLKQIK